MSSKPSQVYCASCGEYMNTPYISETNQKFYHKWCLPELKEKEEENSVEE